MPKVEILPPTLISETQSTFVIRKLITYNILIAHDMFHGLRTNKTCQNKFKTMSKAYNMIE